MRKTLALAMILASGVASVASAQEERRAPTSNPGYDAHRWADSQAPSPAPAPAPVVQAAPAPVQEPAPAPAPIVAAPAATVAPAPVVEMGPPSVEGRTPLVTVRFTKPEVNYQKQLYNAVAEAVKVSPNVMFDVVGYPAASTGKTPGMKAAEVAGVLNRIGVPQSRITVQTKPSKGYVEEVMVYVR